MTTDRTATVLWYAAAGVIMGWVVLIVMGLA